MIGHLKKGKKRENREGKKLCNKLKLGMKFS